MGIFDFFSSRSTDKKIKSLGIIPFPLNQFNQFSLRVPYKNQKYYINYLITSEKIIAKFLELADRKDLNAGQLKNLYFNAYIDSMNALIALYSAGSPIEWIKQFYIQVIEYFEKGWNKEVYESMLWMVSLGILLEIEEKDFDRLVKLLDKEQFQDYFLDYLIAYRKPGRTISEQVNFENYYKGALETIHLAKPEAEQRLKKYLEQEWYQSSKDTYWHNNHMSPNNTYFGYWSFESGAIVKIMGLDDSSFKDNEYYPYDLVHWKQTQA